MIWHSLATKLHEDSTSAALTVVLILLAIAIVIFALTVKNKWAKATAIAYIVLP